MEETYRPDYVELLWHGPGMRDIDRRVPEDGKLNTQGSVLGTVLIELDDVAAGDRLVVIKGIKGRVPISGAHATIPFVPGKRQEHELVLQAWRDADQDNLPDDIDPCPQDPAPGCTAPAEPPPLDAGSTEPDAEAPADAAEDDAATDDAVIADAAVD